MTDYDRWLTTEPAMRCDSCNKVLADEYYEDVDNDRIYCDLRCQAENEAQRAERAYDRYLEDYYGGDQPVTEREQYEAAWKQKRDLT